MNSGILFRPAAKRWVCMADVPFEHLTLTGGAYMLSRDSKLVASIPTHRTQLSHHSQPASQSHSD